jgi:HPt (histidine-containing phosphotransfer) domain-containing protein
MTLSVPSADPLADLRPAYAERLHARVLALAEFLDDAREGKLLDAAVADNHRCVHSMTSSAAIFGHAELSRHARAAEQAFEQRSEVGTQSLINRIEALLASAKDVLDVYRKPGK